MAYYATWSDDDLALAVEELRRSHTLAEACIKIGKTLRRRITPRPLWQLFNRHGLQNPGTYLLREGEVVGDRRPSSEPEFDHSIDVDTTDLETPMVEQLATDAVDDEQDDTPTLSRKAPAPEQLSELARKLLREMSKGPREAEDLCNQLDASPKRLQDAIEEARDLGYIVDVAGPFVGRAPHRPGTIDEAKAVDVASAGERRIFAVASDIHVGSKFFLKDAFQDFIHKAYDRGARCILGPGDITDGVYKHSQWEEYAHGFHEQAHEAARVFPRLPGLEYYSIAGNHDQTHEEGSGLEVCSAYENVFREHGRDDFHMIGSRGAYIRLGAPGEQHGLLVELWHPKGGGAYALSYKLQKHIEGYAPGIKPDACFMGHFHQQCYFVQRGVHAISSGTFHGGFSPFGKAIGVSPSIGGWIVQYALTDGGTVRDFEPTWVSYYEREAVRDVAIT